MDDYCNYKSCSLLNEAKIIRWYKNSVVGTQWNVRPLRPTPAAYTHTYTFHSMYDSATGCRSKKKDNTLISICCRLWKADWIIAFMWYAVKKYWEWLSLFCFCFLFMFRHENFFFRIFVCEAHTSRSQPSAPPWNRKYLSTGEKNPQKNVEHIENQSRCVANFRALRHVLLNLTHISSLIHIEMMSPAFPLSRRFVLSRSNCHRVVRIQYIYSNWNIPERIHYSLLLA